jgi:hypothetical protein
VSVGDLIGLSRDLGARFTLVGVLPMALLALFVLALIWSGAPAEAPDPGRILDEARDLDAWSAALLFLGLVVAALVAQPLQLALVRALEGYWAGIPLGAAMSAPGRALQNRRLERLEQRLAEPVATIDEAHALFLQRTRTLPRRPERLLPTRLGNVLRAGEERAGAPYGLDAVAVWPRLYPLLPETTRALVDDLRDQLDLGARLCVTFLAAAAISLALLAQHGWWLAVPAACLLLAWLAYRGTLASGLAYGDGMRTALDLHRFALLQALHLPLPTTRAAELVVNRQLTDFLVDDAPIAFLYSHDGTGTAPPEGHPMLPEPPGSLP